MRLWHQYIINYLPDKQLLGQHREICALRGLGFGKKHSVVNYVFNHPYYYLYKFHLIVMKEMRKRNFFVEKKWYDARYRGKNIGIDNSDFTLKHKTKKIIYKEHDTCYLEECLRNLNSKGVYLQVHKNSFLYKNLLLKNLVNYIEIID